MYKAGSLDRGIIPDLCCPENILTGRSASHISLLGAISCPIAQEPTGDDEIWALQPGRGLAVPKQELAVLTACCQLQGLLTACSHHFQCSHQDSTTSATTAEKPNAALSTHTEGPAGKLEDTGEPQRGQSSCNIYNTAEYPGFFIIPKPI